MFNRLQAGFGALMVAATLLAGCGALKPDPETDAAALRIYGEVQRNNPALQARLAPELKTPEAIASLAEVRSYMPKGKPVSSRTVRWNTFSSVGGPTTKSYTQVHEYGDEQVIAETRLRQDAEGSPWRLEGFHVQRVTAKEIEANRFTLIGKSPAQLAFLAAAILSLLLMIGALVKVIRRPGLRRKWLWGILAFLTVSVFQLNWTTGGTGVQWLNIGFINAGIGKGLSGLDPWFIKFGFPIGALLILSGLWANPKRAKIKPVKAPRTEPEGS